MTKLVKSVSKGLLFYVCYVLWESARVYSRVYALIEDAAAADSAELRKLRDEVGTQRQLRFLSESVATRTQYLLLACSSVLVVSIDTSLDPCAYAEMSGLMPAAMYPEMYRQYFNNSPAAREALLFPSFVSCCWIVSLPSTKN